MNLLALTRKLLPVFCREKLRKVFTPVIVKLYTAKIYIQKLEIYEFDIHLIFTAMCGREVEFVMLSFKRRIGGRSYSSTTDTLLAFYTNKTKAASTEINLLSLIHVLGLDET